MELRIIDGQHFIVQHNGKLESIQTLAEAKQAEQIEIEESRASIGQLDTAVSVARQRLESELIDGVDTAATRAELAALGEEIHAFQSDIDEAVRRIKQVDALIEQHTAAGIQQADAAHLAALTAHFDKSLEKLA